MSWADKIEATINSLAEAGEWYKAFLIAHKLSKIGKKFTELYKKDAVDFWNTNKELPAWYSLSMKSSGKKFDYSTDPKWQLLNAEIKAREALLEQATLAPAWIQSFDELGEVVPRVKMSEWVTYVFYQK